MYTQGENIVVLSANLRGLQDARKREDVLNYYKELDPNILCLQDTHWTNKNIPDIKRIWNGEIVINGSSTNSRGVAILFSKNFEYEITNINKDTNGNLLDINITTNDLNVKIINIYAPNTDSPEFFSEIDNILYENNQDYTIVCGDFNLVLNPLMDARNYLNLNNPQARQTLLNTIETHNLCDIYRQKHPTIKRYTWRRTKPIKQARLDYFIISETLVDLVNNISILPGYRSDHSIIKLSLQITKFIRHKGRWQFNTSLLFNREYIRQVNNLIDQERINYTLPVYNYTEILNINEYKIQYTIPDDLLLEMVLLKIRELTIYFSKRLKTKQNKQEQTLIKDIEKLESDEHKTEIMEILKNKKDELENIRQNKLKGNAIRSRAEWLKETEKPTNFFCSLENRNYLNKTIKKLILDNDETITKQDQILESVKTFYQNLFANKDHALNVDKIPENLYKLKTPKLTESQKIQINGLLTEKELANALKKMKHNKTPGIDGFPAEFFKMFWAYLKAIITRALNYSYNKGELSISLRQCVITCLPKGNKAREYLKNWRPLSMLSVVYKLASSALATRIKPILNDLIPPTQTGFIDGRFIGDSTRLIYDLIQIANERNLSGLLVLIDFEKAFDSISWNFLYQTLEFYNFPHDYIKWIKLLNFNITATVMQSGAMSNFFPIERGCRQGDPIAAYLFILCGNILNLMITSNSEIKGLTIDNNEYVMTQFADDTTMILDGTTQSLQATLNILEIFGTLSGLKMNTEKTKIVWLGRKRNSKDELLVTIRLNWGSTEFTLLGINFSTNLQLMHKLNYDKILSNVTRELNNWKKRNFTPIGKIVILKTLILSKFTHLFSILPTPTTEFTRKLEKLFYDYLWDGKPDKIKRQTVSQEYYQGGLKMINIQNFIVGLKATWIKRTISSFNSQWIQLFQTTITTVNKIQTRGLSWLKYLATITSNEFWKDTLLAYAHVSQLQKITDNQEINTIPLWYNDLLTEQPVFFKNWQENGIDFIDDIISQDGSVITLDHLQNKYNCIISWFEYIRIHTAVTRFININKTENSFETPSPYLPFHLKILYKKSKGSKHLYTLVNHSNIIFTARAKWNSDLKIQLSELNWQDIFHVCHHTIEDNYYIFFQYRIIHRILGTRKLLHKIKIEENGLCGLCNLDIESLHHLYIDCPETQYFWRNLSNWIKSKSNKTLLLTNINKLFGYLHRESNATAINTILIIARKHIFDCAKNKCPLSLTIFQNHLSKVYNEQKTLFCLNNKSEIFEKKWLNYSSVISENG